MQSELQWNMGLALKLATACNRTRGGSRVRWGGVGVRVSASTCPEVAAITQCDGGGGWRGGA